MPGLPPCSPTVPQQVLSRLGNLKDAAVAALDYIDRTCDAFLDDNDDDESRDESLDTVDRADASCCRPQRDEEQPSRHRFRPTKADEDWV